MAALLARAALGGGLVVELHEGGVLLITEGSGKRQEIKLEAEAPASLLAFLEKNRDLLQPAAQAQNAVREWHTRAIVRVLETSTSRSVWPATERAFQQGEELEMVQWGEAGRPVERNAWWTSFDIDAAHNIDASKVEVVRVIEEIPPI